MDYIKNMRSWYNVTEAIAITLWLACIVWRYLTYDSSDVTVLPCVALTTIVLFLVVYRHWYEIIGIAER